MPENVGEVRQGRGEAADVRFLISRKVQYKGEQMKLELRIGAKPESSNEVRGSAASGRAHIWSKKHVPTCRCYATVADKHTDCRGTD